MTTVELLELYLQCFFVKREPKKIYSLLTEDVHCYGFAEDKVIENLAQGHEMLDSGKYDHFMDYQLDILEKQTLSEECAVLVYSLTSNHVQIKYRLIGTSKMTETGRKLWLLNFAMINPMQKLTMFEDLKKENKRMEKIQKGLRQSKAVTDLASTFAKVWVIQYDTENGICYPDERLRRQFGFPEVITGFPESMFAYDYILPEYKACYCDAFRRLGKDEPEIDFDIQTKYPDGSVHWVRFRGQLLPEMQDVAESIVDAVISAQEVDMEKEMEARIKLEEKQQANGGVNLLAHFITNVTQNKPVEHSYHFEERPSLQHWHSIEEQLNRTVPYIVRQEKRDDFCNMHNSKYLAAQYEQGKTEFELAYRRRFPDDKIIWVRSVIHLVKEPHSGDIMNYEYLYNIHEQRISEELLEAVVSFGFERCASLMVDSNQVTILHAHHEDEAEAFEVTDYTAVNLGYAEKILPEDREFYLNECALENIREKLKKKDYFEIMHRTLEDGEIHYKKDQCFRYSQEHTICLLIRSDVTDMIIQEQKKQKLLQEALDVAENATQAKSEFLSRMSHEIRTPMNAIMGMTAIAKENQSDFLQVSECLNKIDTASQYLLTLINDILEMSRIESGRIEIKESVFDFFSLMDSIKTVIEPLALKSNIRYEFIDQTEKEQSYQGDRMRIQQVIVNLLTNAIKFTRSGGKVRFSVKAESQDDQKTIFRFVVADTGIGMSEAFMARMFQPFVQEDSGNTSEYGGNGLGLAISKSLTEAMGGTIQVESFQGIGSTFTVILPLKRAQRTVAMPKTEQSFEKAVDLKCLENCHVLMAEDHPLNVMVATKLLQRRKMQVTVAENGKKAVDIFRKSEINHFDVILMDIRMPVMDGLDATKIIRSLDRPDAATIPIIAMTANALEEDRQRSVEAGMNAHLAKPFEPLKLYQMLVELIQQS